MLRRWLTEHLAVEPILGHWRRLMLKRQAIVLTYHEVLSDAMNVEAWTVVRESELRRQLEYLKREFRVVSLAEALGIMQESSDNGPPPAVVTFDDGYVGNRRCLLPLVEELEVPVTVFVSTGAVQTQERYSYNRIILALQKNGDAPRSVDLRRWGLKTYQFGPRMTGERRWTRINDLLDGLKSLAPAQRLGAVEDALRGMTDARWPGDLFRPLSVTELREMSTSPWVTIGAHSHCHSILVQLSEAQIQDSVEMSRRLLQEWTGQSVEYFAYPNGDYDQRVINAVTAAGFRCGMTVVSRPWSPSDSPFAIPRIGIGRYDTFDVFRAKVSGLSL